MKLLLLLLAAFAFDATVASTWFSKAVYNKWHETELERWLSDHNVPYPTPADRKDLENLVKDNWNSKVVTPYSEWSDTDMTAYLKSKGVETKDYAAANKDSLVAQVKNYWYETEDKAEEAYSSVKDWIFDSWTDSQLKAFCDKNGMTTPQPRKRDTVLSAIRSNYEAAAKKLGETAAYPGDWIYSTWSESDLKEWLDEHGVSVPQPSTRDKLIASVRRNSRLASLKMADMQASASKSASSATETLSDKLLDAWSDSQIRTWCEKNKIRVPQGSKRNELLAIAKKHRGQLSGDTVSDFVSSGFGAATSAAGNQYAKASEDVKAKADDAFNSAVDNWSDSRLRSWLDSRGIPVPKSGKRDEILAAVRLNKHKAATGFSAWTFDTWTYDNLKAYLTSTGDSAAQKAANKAGASRDDLLTAAQSAYSSASKAGGSSYATVTSYLAKQTDNIKDSTFESWSDSELKSYMDSYGVPNYQGSTRNELIVYARNTAHYFKYGTSTPQGTLWKKLQDAGKWVMSQLGQGASAGRKQAEAAGDAVADGAAKATDKVREEL